VNSIHLGWSPFFENQLASGDRSRYSVGRIPEDRKNRYVLLTEDGREMLALVGSSGVGKSKAQSDEKKRWKAIAVANRERADEGGNL
jgi:hypothetical protein